LVRNLIAIACFPVSEFATILPFITSELGTEQVSGHRPRLFH